MDANTMPLGEAVDLLNRHLSGTMFDHQPQRAISAVLAALSQPPAVAVPEEWPADLLMIADLLERGQLRQPKAAARTIRRLVKAVSAAPPDPAQADPLAPIRQAISDYHYALDTRQHEGMAIDRALEAIKTSLAMPWVPGAEKARRDAPQAQEGGL